MDIQTGPAPSITPRTAAPIGRTDTSLLAEWTRCRAWLMDALELAHGTHRQRDIFEGVRSGRFYFWPGERCAVIGEIVDYPQVRSLRQVSRKRRLWLCPVHLQSHQ